MEKHFRRGCGAARFRFWPAFLGLSIVVVIAFVPGGTAYGDGYTLQVSGMPLANVLNELSQKSGVKFLYDEAWSDFPITVQFKNLSLEPALRRIFSKISHAIVYNPDGSILIRIYESVSHEIEPNPMVGSGVVPSYPGDAAYQYGGMPPARHAEESPADTAEKTEESMPGEEASSGEVETEEAGTESSETVEEGSESGKKQEEVSEPGDGEAEGGGEAEENSAADEEAAGEG